VVENERCGVGGREKMRKGENGETNPVFIQETEGFTMMSEFVVAQKWKKTYHQK
jgi:hypothetical protein